MQQINTALCSYGMSSNLFHVPFLISNPGFKITKVLERNKQNSRAKLPDAQIVRSYAEIIDDPQIDLVIVNTPNEFHFQMTKEALLRGKNVLVEKPFTTSVNEGEELINLAQKNKKVLTVYQNRRLDGDFKTLEKLLGENYLGNIKLFDSQILRWKPDIGHKLWKVNSDKGAGLLFDLGAHLIDQVLDLFGKPEALFADLRTLRPGVVADDYFELLFFYEDFKVSLRSSLLASDPGHRFILQGDKACYTKFGDDPQEKMLTAGLVPVSEDWGKEEESNWGIINSGTKKIRYQTLNGSYQDYFSNLYRAIVYNEELLVKPEEALDVIRIIECAQKSAGQRKVIDL